MTVQSVVSDPVAIVRRWDDEASRGEKARAARELGVFPTAVSSALRAAKREKSTSLTDALAAWIVARSQESASDPDFVKLASDLLSLVTPSRNRSTRASALISALRDQFPYACSIETEDIEDVVTRLFPVVYNGRDGGWDIIGYIIAED